MAIFKNITTDADHTLRDLSGSTGPIKRILFVNKATSGNPCVITLFLYDTVSPNPTYTLLHTSMPPQTNLLIDDQVLLAYNTNKYQLKLTTAVDGGTSALDVIIK